MIHCPHPIKKEFLCQLEDEVYLYCEEHNNENFDGLSRHFGLPKDVADNFLSELGTVAMESHSSILQIVFIALISVLIVFAVIFLNSVNQNRSNAHYNEAITYEQDLTPGATGSTYWVEEFKGN